VSIGTLVVAVIAGGLTSNQHIATFFDEPAIVEARQEPEPKPEPGLETVANQLLDTVQSLTEGVQHSVSGLEPISAVDQAWVTHYGERFNGRTLGCETGTYSSDDASIVAVSYERNKEWGCGTILKICGPGGCLVAERVDTCPGCGADHVDLSEQGLEVVCGPGAGVCQASVAAYEPACEIRAPSPGADQNGSMELFVMLAEIALKDRTAGMLDLEQEELRTKTCVAQAPPAD
jgi:hypothetical protein